MVGRDSVTLNTDPYGTRNEYDWGLASPDRRVGTELVFGYPTLTVMLLIILLVFVVANFGFGSSTQILFCIFLRT